MQTPTARTSTSADKPAFTDAEINAKYAGRFIVTRYSPAQSRSIQVGKACATIEAARKKAVAMDRRRNDWLLHFIDVRTGA
jgi:hypothetical protein